MLTADIDASGVLAASGGNFGLAVAYAAKVLGHPAEIFVPSTSPAMKIEKIRAYGATVHVIDGFYAEAYAACEERAFDTGAAFMHPYDQPAVVAGQGTLGRRAVRPGPGARHRHRRGRRRRSDRGRRRLVRDRHPGHRGRAPAMPDPVAGARVRGSGGRGGGRRRRRRARRAARGLDRAGDRRAVRAAGRPGQRRGHHACPALLWDACAHRHRAGRGRDPRGAAQWGVPIAARRADRARPVRRQHRPVGSGDSTRH